MKTSTSRLEARDTAEKIQHAGARLYLLLHFTKIAALYATRETSLKLRPGCVNPVGGNPWSWTTELVSTRLRLSDKYRKSPEKLTTNTKYISSILCERRFIPSTRFRMNNKYKFSNVKCSSKISSKEGKGFQKKVGVSAKRRDERYLYASIGAEL